MESRKRPWRDPEGNIVTKRPAPLSHQSPMSVSLEEGLELSNEIQADANLPIADGQQPLMSRQSDDLMSHQQMSNVAVVESVVVNQSTPDMLDFLANSSWGTQSFDYSVPATQADAPYDDMFNPDTGGTICPGETKETDIMLASSFNMLFTTMNNYNWLFDRD